MEDKTLYNCVSSLINIRSVCVCECRVNLIIFYFKMWQNYAAAQA